jgi:hypothetical protein
MNEHVTGYKATLWSGMPKKGHRRTPYGVGGVYSTKARLELCTSGLHFCRQLCFTYETYDSAFYTRVFAVESRGEVCFGGNKLCTDRLKFVRELTPCEVLMQLAGDANDMHTAMFACNKAMNILLSVISMDIEIKDLNTNIVETPRERDHMPALYHAKRRLQWAQAFNEYSEIPICRLAMHDCGITKPKLVELVDTLRQDPILQAANKENGNEN